MFVQHFDGGAATDKSHVGGKGANLGALTQAGFAVPSGFTVTTAAYRRSIHEGGVGDKILAMAERLDPDDVEALAAVTADIRALITDMDIPGDVAAAVTEAYDLLGSGSYVAVRSSGTAEDLAEASFAGLHDTYLDVRGALEVLDAVKRCWASMWTARATSYRQTKGFDHAEASLAVVVQTMVESEVSGVMFTANPITAATDEIVINASWGLGEAIVSGVVTPDEYTVKLGTLAVQDRKLGSKRLRIVRDRDTGIGTRTLDVADADRARFALPDDELVKLAELGRRVMAHYGGVPQDIEWAREGSGFVLLQSRPVTGVTLSWDEDVEDWQRLPEDDSAIWTREWADVYWNGAITPLMYSWRGDVFTQVNEYGARLWGAPEMAAGRLFKYHRGEAYRSCAAEAAALKHTTFPVLRELGLAGIPPEWRADVRGARFGVLDFLRLQARILGLGDQDGHYAWMRRFEADIVALRARAEGLPDADLRLLSDPDLRRYTEGLIQLELDYIRSLWTGFFLHGRDVLGYLFLILTRWYDGGNPTAFTDLCTGTTRRTATAVENHELWQLAERIRQSPDLRGLFAEHRGRAFFEALPATAAGRDFLERYRDFVSRHGHRGHADRDLYYPRRAEDPGVDYRAFQALLNVADPTDPEEMEARANRLRADAAAEVVANLRGKPLGGLRAEAFNIVFSYVEQLLAVRDDVRAFGDVIMYAAKRGFLEMGRRLRERGLFETEREVFFLSREELYRTLEGRPDPLLRSRLEGRMANFDQFLGGEWKPPMWLQGRRAVELEAPPALSAGTGTLAGIPTSRGTVRGTARVLRSHDDIGRLQGGDILVTASTDPGWTPAFLVVGAVVCETGGMLAHFSCLSREYGLPAVQLADAMSLIPDGATITVDGDTGTVRITGAEETP